MKSDPAYINASAQVFRVGHANRRTMLVPALFACLALAMQASKSLADNCVLTANDGSGQDSFLNAQNWSPNEAPSATTTNFTLGFSLRTPADGNPHIFLGTSLTCSNSVTAQFPGTSIVCKGTGGATVTVTNLIMLNGSGIGNANNQGIGQICWVAGNMSVQGTVLMSDINAGPRWVGIASAISGSGILSNNCQVIYSGNNVNYTGALASGASAFEIGNITVTNEAAMGGNPPGFNAAQLELNGGQFSPAASFALDYANAGVTVGPLGGLINIAPGLTLTNLEPLAGSGTLQLTNTGTLLFQGSAATFTGTLAVNGGDFIVGASGSLIGANTILAGSAGTLDVSAAGLSMVSQETLTGSGAVIGSVSTAGGTITAGNGAAGTLAISGNLTLSNGSTNGVYFGATNSVIAVGGNFSPGGVTIIQLKTIPVVGTYPLITVAGTLGGSPANFKVAALSTRTRNYSITYDTIGNRVLLTVSSSGSAANLVWEGDTTNGVDNVWDVDLTPNWLNGATRDVYFDGDTVNFTDLDATNQPTLDVVVNPGAVNFNSSSNYTLTTVTGAGDIAGPATVTDGGTGTVTLSVTNDTYTGGTVVTNGVLQAGVPHALGSPAGTTPLVSVSGSGTFNINGLALDTVYTNAIQINGNGVSATQGAIDNTAGGLTTGGGDVGIATLSLAGNSIVSATANWQIGSGGLGIIGHGFTLTKIGGDSTGNFLYLRTNSVSALGNFVIAGGGVLFWDHADSLGVTTPITLTNGGTIDTWNPATQFAGLTFYNPIIVSDPVSGGWILNRRLPYDHPPADVFNGPITLNGPLTFSNVAFVAANQYNNNQNTYGKITVNGSIGGTNGVVVQGGTQFYLANGFQGGNEVVFNGNNSYSGGTLVTNLIQLFITTANQSGGSYDIVDNATLDVATTPGNTTIPISNLTLDSQNIGPGNLSFTRLTSMPSVPVIYATNFTVVAGGAVIVPPVAGYSIGQFPLIKYSGTIGGAGFGGLTLATPPAGVSATLVNNTANNSIDLNVTSTGIVWTGNVSSNWDTGTANWNNSGPTTYSDGQTVIFNDTASGFAVNVGQVVQPAGVTVSATDNYIFSNVGGGSINGSAALIKNGPGTLTVSCTNNNFTGGTFINGGTIKLADTNYVFPYGGGALNNNLGNVTVANGGTLDVNAIQVPNFQSFGPEGYNVFISGSGVGGNGALVNNSTNNNDNADPGYVTLVGDATVGGIGDINIRHGVSPQLSSRSGAYTLTKVGADQFRIRYLTTVSTNFGTINILQGIVSYESSSTLGLGDASKPIYVGNGGGFAWGTAAATCVRPLICSNGSTIYGYNIANNVFNSPVTLVSGNVNLNANFYDGMIFSNVISGAGGITLQFQSLATLAASNTFTGNTTVADCNTSSGTNNGSLLKLVGNGSINNSPQIWLQGVTASQAFAGNLDVRGRVDGTLTLANQTLRGDNGSYIRGNVLANSGAIVSPGGANNIQSMICSNNLTLTAGSTAAMEVDLDTGLSNDVVTVAGTNNYGGTLQLSNIGVTALTNGAAFKLFNNAHFSGNFANFAGSPGSGLAWSFNPTNGVATVVATSVVPTVSPKIIGFSLTGANAVLSGTNGVSGGTYYLLESTNITSPLNQWIPVATNVMSVSGPYNSFTLTETNVVNSNAKHQFYILSSSN